MRFSSRVGCVAVTGAIVCLPFLAGCNDHYRALPAQPYVIVFDQSVVTQGGNLMMHATVPDNTHACEFLVVDYGTDRGVIATLAGSPPYVQNHMVTINVTATSQAPLGFHDVGFKFSSADGSEYDYVFHSSIRVRCLGCPPPPVLSEVYTPGSVTDFIQMRRGTTAIARFLGLDFLNNSPVVEFLTPGLSVDPNATITVQHSGTGLDFFDLPIVAAPNMPPGQALVRVATTGGISESQHINVVANPSYVIPPSDYPRLIRITPDTVTSGADVLIKCEGTGFGLAPEVSNDSKIPIGWYPVMSSDANPDEVVVAKLQLSGYPNAEGYVKIQVKNSVTGRVSDDFRIYVQPPRVNLPAATNDDTVVVHRGGDCDLQIRGIYGDPNRDHLDGTINSSWHGIPGLTFSNTNISTSEGVTTVTAHVHADFVGPLTGDEGTNLRITNIHGESNPFVLRVLP